MNKMEDQNYQGFNMNQPQQPQQNQGQYYYNQNQEQQPDRSDANIPMAPQGKNTRPFVDPNAEGEVDPTSYPEPKESTHKIRGRSDILEMLCSNMSQELLIAKTFYFFFFSAFGSLFPLMAVYFKQMGLNPGQTGILVGCRPFVEFVATPFWGSIADKFQKGKLMLLCAVAAWIIFTVSLGFVQPPATSCVVFNGSHHILRDPYTESSVRKKRSIDQEDFMAELSDGTKEPHLELPVLPHLFHKRSVNLEDDSIYVEVKEPMVRDIFSNERSLRRTKRDTPLPPNHVIGKSPNVVHYTVNFADFNQAEEWLSPPFSSIVYRESDVQKVFFLLLLLVILGEFFSCPAITLADTAVLNYLGDEADQYGSQRMFGSLGWGLAMFFVGIALDNSTAFPGHPCGPHEKERNYSICFAVFSVLMGCAFITATQFKFENVEAVSNTIPMEEVKEPIDSGPRPWNEPKIPMQQTKTKKQQFEEAIGTIKTRIYANTMRELPEWMVVLREFKTIRLSTFLFVAWWMGFGIGLIFCFLFWHLQDVGGTPTVFGIASVINHISEIFAYFFSFRLIAQIGHVKVLCVGLLGNVLRFLYISLIKDPWLVLPFEFIQGITHAAVWAACCSYVAHNIKPELRGASQGVLQGIHHGFGRGAGAIIGGLFVNYFGTSTVFRAYSVLSLVVLGVFVFLNFYRKDVGFTHELPPEEDPRQMAEEGTALAPHGVPSTNPMGRAHSSQKLNELGDQSSGYGTYGNNGTLDIPGGGGGSTASNPFMSGGASGGGGDGYQYNMDLTGGADPLISGPINAINYPPSNPFRDEILGDALYHYKGSPISSPDLGADYDVIKNRFQAYNALLSDFTEGKLPDSKVFSEENPDQASSLQPSFVN